MHRRMLCSKQSQPWSTGAHHYIVMNCQALRRCLQSNQAQDQADNELHLCSPGMCSTSWLITLASESTICAIALGRLSASTPRFLCSACFVVSFFERNAQAATQGQNDGD
jgi:hypothetical protein